MTAVNNDEAQTPFELVLRNLKVDEVGLNLDELLTAASNGGASDIEDLLGRADSADSLEASIVVLGYLSKASVTLAFAATEALIERPSSEMVARMKLWLSAKHSDFTRAHVDLISTCEQAWEICHLIDLAVAQEDASVQLLGTAAYDRATELLRALDATLAGEPVALSSLEDFDIELEAPRRAR